MNVLRTHFLSVLFLVLLGIAPATAQTGSSGPTGHLLVSNGEKSGSNVYRLHYNLKQGESITYRVLSFDSLVIWTETPRILVRERVERVTYTCDTILPEGYGMTVRLDGVVVREKLDSLPWIMKTDHAWLGVPIHFLMGPTGERIRLRDTLDGPGVMPGAPFQPLLLPFLGSADSVSSGAGSVFDRKMWLLDNVYPPIYFNGGAMRKIHNQTDTLGHVTLPVELSEVGQSNYSPEIEGAININTHMRLNGAGLYFLDLETGLPVTGEYQLIANLTFGNKEQGEREGRQMIFMNFAIDNFSTELEDVFGETE